MEQIKMPTIEQRDKNKEAEQKNTFEILTSELAGKTRDELTPEQRETEDTFREKEFRDLMQLINDDKVLLHNSPELESILKHGILSVQRAEIKRLSGLNFGKSDPREQNSAEEFIYEIVPAFLTEYVKYKQGEISEEQFIQYREKVIEEFPKLGEKRAKHYFERVIPNGFDKGWFGIDDWEFIFQFHLREPLKIKETLRKLKKQEVLGFDIISTSNTSHLKKKFVERDKDSVETYLFSNVNERYRHAFFFDRPSEDKIIPLDYDARKSAGKYYKGEEKSKEENIRDLGVASKVNTNSFRAVSLGNVSYDVFNRVCFSGHISDEVLDFLWDKQRNNDIILLDHTFQVIPPLKSVLWMSSVSEKNNCAENLEAETRVIELNEKKTKEKIKQLIKENHWDWYEKYGEKE